MKKTLTAVVFQVLETLFSDRAPVATLRDQDLTEYFDLDSMDAVDLAMELENRLNRSVTVPPAALVSLEALVAAVGSNTS